VKRNNKEIDNSDQSTIKKTLKIYSIISNVNKGMLKDEVSGIDEEKQDQSNTFNVLAIEADTGKHTEEEETKSETSEGHKFAKALATVEEDEKALVTQLNILNKREKMITQLHSNVTKNSYRK
jgi:DNA-directed RNA polymerase specialized sigma subunit